MEAEHRIIMMRVTRSVKGVCHIANEEFPYTFTNVTSHNDAMRAVHAYMLRAPDVVAYYMVSADILREDD